MVVVVFIIILLALFVFILPYIIIAGILAIPIYVAYYCINKYANRSEYFDTETDTLGPVETLVVDRLLERLARYDLSKAEIELLFGKEWRNELSRLDYAPADLFYKIAQMKIDLISPRNPFRKKVSHIIDKVIRIIDSVWIEYPQEVKQFEKTCNDQAPGGYDWVEREWEFFRKYKKPSSEYSENTLDKSEAYEILGLSISATLAQVKKRYRELALKHHPDKNEPAIKTEAEKKFVRINQAYETIMGAA